MDSMFVMIDMIVAGFGCYILYGWFLMKSKGEVKENLILPKGMTMKHCKDRAGFIAEIQPKMLVFGIATLACGAMGILNDFTQLLGNIYLVITIIFLVVGILVWKNREKRIEKIFLGKETACHLEDNFWMAGCLWSLEESSAVF